MSKSTMETKRDLAAKVYAKDMWGHLGHSGTRLCQQDFTAGFDAAITAMNEQANADLDKMYIELQAADQMSQGLEHTIAEQKEKIQALELKLDRLNNYVVACYKQMHDGMVETISSQRNLLSELRETCLELRKHSRHNMSCDSIYTDKACDCGYNIAVEKYRALTKLDAELEKLK